MSHMSNGKLQRWHGGRYPAGHSYTPTPLTRPTTTNGRADPWHYWAVIRRQAPFALGIFVVVVLAAVAGTLLQTPAYRASGLMEIRRASSEAVSMESLFTGEGPSNAYLETQHGLLRSQALALRVVGDLDLVEVPELSDPEKVPPRTGGAEAYSPTELQPVVAAFHERLSVGADAGGRLVRVSFDAEDPVLASDVVNSIMDSFVELRMDGSAEASSWLTSQLADARASLQAAERELQDYAEANGLPLARGDEDIAAAIQARLDALETEMMAARAERLAAQARHRTMVDRGASEAMDNAVLEDLAFRISELQREHARLTATFREEYPGVQRLEREIASLEARRVEERERLARGVTGEYESALDRERLLEQAVSTEKAESDSLMRRAAGYRILRREVDANRERYAAMREKLMDAEVATAVSAVDVDVVDRAVPPLDPYRPSLPLNAAFAFLGGAILALGGAFVREYLFPTDATAPEIHRAIDAPVLAVIPRARRGEDAAYRRSMGRSGDRTSASVTGTQSPSRRIARGDRAGVHAITQAMGDLRSAVLFDQGPSAARSILVTSAAPGEGKTTVAVNFALSLAGMGRDVLLIDANMRRPSVGRALELGGGPGLVQYLDRSEDEWAALVRRDHMPGLDVLLAGGRPAAPDSLLASTRLTSLLASSQELYDFVVIDGPALFIEAPDAGIMAEHVDGVVAVVRGGSGTDQGTPVLSHVPNLLGIILNDREAVTPKPGRSHDPSPAPDGDFPDHDDETSGRRHG